jgi:hypothetical protein
MLGRGSNITMAASNCKPKQEHEQATTIEQTVQFPGLSSVAQLESAVSQAEQLRDQQVQQEYSDQLGVCVQEKAGANQPAAIQLGCGLEIRAGAVASHSTETTWLDGR